jgi:hypothetical protein
VGRRPLPGADHTVADIRELGALLPVFEGAAVVYHLAAKITLATVDSEAWAIMSAVQPRWPRLLWRPRFSG